MVAVFASGGGAAVAVPLMGQAASVQLAVATTASEAAFSAAVAAHAAGAATAAEMTLGAAVAAESVATAAAGVAATNIWNPAGWILGGVLIGASQSATGQAVAVTWGCYKPIFGETDSDDKTTKPISFAELTAHPQVRSVFVATSSASAGLPDVEVENHAGEHFLLRGVALPWGSAAYHADRIYEHSDISMSAAKGGSIHDL
ncbi:hypothetical protein Asppvi_010736 [Aspergillus pseudoviridinutans]|uniref:Uncharacterized protein n=1 Tax=Aspergillus pseudoviridinutans TaxID=1517512 RepID=A0A9P3F082_9EURO|nr:uncharacterized protein Asppvi_010736 [Aspergillus pseudoviridinutans]GIJ91763.1 hypothetical protein Asppvi_010736 [Aspergillus pseudoviridinutans]